MFARGRQIAAPTDSIQGRCGVVGGGLLPPRAQKLPPSRLRRATSLKREATLYPTAVRGRRTGACSRRFAVCDGAGRRGRCRDGHCPSANDQWSSLRTRSVQACRGELCSPAGGRLPPLRILSKGSASHRPHRRDGVLDRPVCGRAQRPSPTRSIQGRCEQSLPDKVGAER